MSEYNKHQHDDKDPISTAFNLYMDVTQRKPWTFQLFDEDGNTLFESKQYKSKAAAASVATRKLNNEQPNRKTT